MEELNSRILQKYPLSLVTIKLVSTPIFFSNHCRIYNNKKSTSKNTMNENETKQIRELLAKQKV